MTSIDPRQPFFPSFEQNTHLPEEPPAPFVPLSKKTKQPSKEEPRQAPSGGKLVHSRPASTYTATSSKPETARKPLQNKQNKQSSESSVNSQSTSPSKTDTLTEQAVHARNGGGQQEQGKGGNSGGGGGVTTADVSGVAQMSAAQELEYLIDEVTPMCANDGLFEVFLPDGERLGIAVSIEAGNVGLLLSPGSGKLAERLRKRGMELKAGLKQRMGKDVMITVL